MRSLTAVVVALVLAGCSVITVDLTPRIRPLEEETVEGRGRAKVLLVDVSGLLTDEGTRPILNLGAAPPRVPMLVRFREELKKASEDRDVRALVVRVNSPGGTVTASDIMFRELMLFKEQAKIPVVAVMMDVAASGGYYVALAADRILAHPTSVTGSIGTILVTVNAEGLMQKIGLGATAVKSAEHKDMGSPFREPRPAELEIFQSVIDELHRQFVDRVVAQRRLAPDAVRMLADGRIYTAEQALGLGLIDGIGYMKDAVEEAQRAADVTEARVIVYHRPREYRATYYARAESGVPGVLDTSLGQLAAFAGPGPRFLYLWWP
jgi:protease IV